MPSHEQSIAFQSSQDFVRALKAASDPPVAGGPSKIEIAQHAWANTSFYMPSKAEVIVDWIFTKLLKEKGRELALNPIFDARYWDLAVALSSTQNSLVTSNDARSTKSWLTALLHRTPLSPIVVAFLMSYKDVSVDRQDALAASVNSCLSVVWHIAVHKMSTELLQECLGGFLWAALAGTPSDGLSSIGRMISSSYRNSLNNSSNKKKLHQSFLQSYLRNWMSVLSTATALLDSTLKISLLDAGIDTMFNLDILRLMHDSRAENPLVERLQVISQTERALVLEHIPQLLVYYVQAIKKNRGALFSQGSQAYATSSKEELHANGMQFFISLLSLVDDSNRSPEAWTARFLLLETVNKENIFEVKQQDSQITFDHLLEFVLLVLGEGWKEEYLECTALAIQCLSVISHIDYDLVLPCVPRILPLLLQIPVASEPHFTFLDILLSYHTKTRTMATLVESLYASIAVPRTCPGGSLQVYQICSSSPVMHTAYMEHLARALQTFLTESQTLPTIQVVLDALKEAWEKVYGRAYQQEDGGNAKKKRRTSAAAFVDTSTDLDDLAVQYSLVARLSSVVLSSLPMSSLPGPAQEEVRRVIDAFRSDFIHHALSKAVKLLRKRGDAEMWAIEVALAASLRLLYALDVSRNLCLPLAYDAKLNGKILELVADDTLLPELTLELFRVLLFNLSQGGELNPEVAINRLLEYTEKNFSATGIVWSGNASHLTRSEIGRAEAALAVMHMVVERWLPDIDRLASPEQLQRLLKTIISIKLPIGQPKAMQPEQLLLEILHSAQFFEFPNIRTVFLELIGNMTARLDPSATKPPKISSMLEKIAIYRHLLLFPMEYFSWPLLNDLINRALTSDVALAKASSQKQGIAEALIVLRVFLQRAYIYCGSIGQDSNKETAEYLIALLKESPVIDTEFKADFTKATLDLVEVYFSKLLKSSKKHGPDPVLQVLDAFPSDLFIDLREISSSTFITLVNLLVKDFPKSSLSPEIIAALRKLHDNVFATLLPRFISIVDMELPQKDLDVYYGLVSAWYSILCLNKWLEATEEPVAPLLGQEFISRLISSRAAGNLAPSSQLNDVGVMSFAVLLQELEIRPVSEHEPQLDLIVAVYIALSDTLSSTSLTMMDAQFGGTCKKLALEDYVHLLSLVAESLADSKHVPPNRLSHLVRLAALLLHEHPSHSLVHVQKFATSCINVFTEHPIFVDGPVALRLQVLNTIVQHCSDQQAALRSQDMAGICLLLSKFLAPSAEHDTTTEPWIFHKIVGVLGALVRQRRDLVTHALPHLGLLLRGLLLCMRACRANLGARQTALVMNTQPRWLSAAQPLGAEEARVLARLLEGLTAKTVVRVLTGPTAAPAKVESLAKPFAKHAAYVLKAYVDAMGMPLVVLALDVRRELLPGLFALCGMVSEHSRDALMVSALDGGGRATLKALWKEYDKQRYVGRG